MSKAAKKFGKLVSLEKFYRTMCDDAENVTGYAIPRGDEITWRIYETPSWYGIAIEDGETTVAYYLTGDWDEVVDFCRRHCNPGKTTLNGLGCTEQELIDATNEYIDKDARRYQGQDGNPAPERPQG